MKTRTALLAGACAAVLLYAGMAQAHTVQQCQQEIKTAGTMCKFSPTAWILGFCKNKKVYQWCSDKKQHDDKFHK